MTTDVDFGTDTHSELSYASGRYASGLLLVAQNALHRLITPPGMLRGGKEEGLYGIDIPGLVGHGVASIATIPSRIRAQLMRDERIADVGTTITESTVGPATTVVIKVLCHTQIGPFELLLSVADGEVTVKILGFEETV